MPWPFRFSFRWIRRFIALSVLAGLGLAGFYFHAARNSENSKVKPNPSPASPGVQVTQPDRAIAPPQVVARRSEKAAGREWVRAPESIRRVLPSVEAAVKDWREFRPMQIAVTPVEGIPLTFERTELREEGRYVTWVGRNRDLPGATFVGVATAAGYDAILVLPGVG